jgi:hypothetical protein
MGNVVPLKGITRRISTVKTKTGISLMQNCLPTLFEYNTHVASYISLGWRPKRRERSFVLGCLILDELCVCKTANGGLDGKRLIESLVIEFPIIDRSVL